MRAAAGLERLLAYRQRSSRPFFLQRFWVVLIIIYHYKLVQVAVLLEFHICEVVIPQKCTTVITSKERLAARRGDTIRLCKDCAR